MGKPTGRMELFGGSDIEGQVARVAARKRGSDRVSNERELMSQEFGGHGAPSAYGNNAMTIAVAAKRQKFSLGSLKSGDRLLKAIKNDFRKNREKIDYDKLRRDGHSKALIARLKGL
jgi:hypothetical protein